MNQMQVGGWEAAEPPREGLRIEWVIDRFSGERAIGSISHPGRAWCAPLGDPFERGQREEVGWLYLAAVAKAAGLDGSKAGWLHPSLLERLNPGQQGRDALDTHPGLGFGWLALTWRGPVSRPSLPDGTGPMGSFWISRARRRVVSGKPKGTLVLLAGNVATDHQLQFGADLGLRIVMHVAAGRACIHGVTLASVCTDRALHAVPECAGALLAPRGLRPFKQAIGQALIDGRVPEGGSEVEYRPDTFKPDIHRPDIYQIGRAHV